MENSDSEDEPFDSRRRKRQRRIVDSDDDVIKREIQCNKPSVNPSGAPGQDTIEAATEAEDMATAAGLGDHSLEDISH